MKRKVRRYRRRSPDQDGWWLWKESRPIDTPERLLIAGDKKHAEVATDTAFALFTGRDYPLKRDDGFSGNYWEMTDCKEMGGLWMLETPVNLTGIN